jgi:AraC-like DNA-binding protein
MLKRKYRMSEIAMMVGYNGISSFSAIFKKVIGIPTTEYFKRIKRD